MNQRACILALTVCTLCTASMSSHANTPIGSDNKPVNGTPNVFDWGDPFAQGAGNLSLTGNSLSYTTVGAPTTVPGPADADFASLNWLSYSTASDVSWIFELPVSMPNLSGKLGAKGQAVQYGLQALDGGSSLSLYVEQFRDATTGVFTRQFHAFAPGVLDRPSDQSKPAEIPTDNDKLRFRFDGVTKELFAEVDSNADDGVDDWITFGQLAAFDLSSLSVFGQSGFTGPATVGPTITNVDGVGATVVPEPSASAVMLAGLAALGWFGVRARRRARPGPA